MKKLVLFLSILIASISFGYSQAPENATTIVITMSDSIGLKEKVLKVLAEKEYTINSGKTAVVVTTAPRTLKNGTRVSFTVKFKGADIIITGGLPVAGQSTMAISFQGKKGTPKMNGWEEMEKLAKALEGKVSYK